MTAPHSPHGVEEPCEAGLALYSRALREGYVPAREAEALPCLVDAGLLQPDSEDAHRLQPVPPAVALSRLQRSAEDDIALRRRRSTRLAETFEPLLALTMPDGADAGFSGIRPLHGFPQINLAISEAMTGVTGEILTIQPDTPTMSDAARAASLERDQALLDRGGRIRTLYQHTQRHKPAIIARYEQLRGDTEARTLDEVTDRLIVIDRRIAFIPANKDRTHALEVRSPALIEYFTTTFDRFWHLATPMYPQTARYTGLGDITPRQYAIARLLVEGHTDAMIADRLGLNVRTARVHIAKLATTLGSDSRAQLGYLIAESGILKQKEAEE
ncbi:helix-turn-helix transcriptional regulator [Streptomyces niveiscabiei]|uniref:helix-turn-helix transcriptional regulator n=1 Tax=Streptomyces niveiscabiei TaxID=164115 RepID=UPI0029B84655|nr:helix-turn-helix transcriptional regulator [Streptomyces niveiscabiei]MDX3382925.1 helix-turn-helix transcriptional regulator [Streptomyces niveiscabiei]